VYWSQSENQPFEYKNEPSKSIRVFSSILKEKYELLQNCYKKFWQKNEKGNNTFLTGLKPDDVTAT
jgi:hypothetical protein